MQETKVNESKESRRKYAEEIQKDNSDMAIALRELVKQVRAEKNKEK